MISRRSALLAFLLPSFLILLPISALGQASLSSVGVAYTQDFNTLASSGTSGTTPAGWAFSESGTNANTLYTAGTGSGNAGDTYSFGATSNAERAFGGLQSSSNVPTIGAQFANNTCHTITSISIAYTGEQWRLGTAGRVDRLDFEYSTNATTLSNGTWTAVDALDFTAPNTVIPLNAKDGNAVGNRTAIGPIAIAGLSIANGQTFWIRWNDFGASGADDGLAVDDFSLTPTGTATTPTISVANTSKLEGDSGSSNMAFTVSLDCPALAPDGVTFTIATVAGGSATAGSDYTTTTASNVNIPAGSDEYTFNVPISGDEDIEPDETINVQISGLSGANSGALTATGTISNDDSPPNLTIADVTQSEGNAGDTLFTFTVQLSAPAKAGGVEFDIATSAGTATEGTDYDDYSETDAFIPQGSTQYQFDVVVHGDTVYEDDQTFNVEISAITGANVASDPADRQALGTIDNDDAAPSFSITDATLLEDGGLMSFTVTASAATEASITLDYDTADGAATDADNDYEPASGTLTFDGSSATSQTVDVTVNDNSTAEGHEDFFVDLSALSAGTLSDAQGRGIILEDDPVSIPTVDTDVTENFDSLATTGTTAVPTPDGWTFLESGSNANFIYAANDGASTAGNTYSYGTTSASDRALGSLASGSLESTFGASFRNDTGTTIQTLTISYAGEQWRAGAVDSPDTYQFTWSSDATSLSTGTWMDVNQLDLSSTATGGAIGSRDGNAGANRTIFAQTLTGLSIAPGEEFWIRWVDEDDSGSDDGLAVDDLVIIANTTKPLLTIDDAVVTEGDSGTQTATFTVSLTQPAPAGGVTFRIATADGTATAGSDYVAKDLAGQTIPQGQTSYVFEVTVNGDGDSEPSEDFFVNLTNITGTDVLVVDPQGRGVIATDDLVTTPIHDIQGSGYVSPFNGQVVSVDGIVTGIKSGSGFFLQEPDSDIDADPNTSEGIFIFTGGSMPVDVVIGNRLAVTGTVEEFPSSDVPDAHTEIAGSLIVSLLEVGQPVPAPVVITPADGAPSDDLSQFERFEGMRVQANLTVVAPTNGNVNEESATATSDGVFHGVITGVARPFREPGIDQSETVPAEADCFWCIPVYDSNPEHLRVDSDRQPGTSPIDVAVGQTVTGIVGVLEAGFFEYTILREAGNNPVIAGDDDAEAVRDPLASELTIAGFNVERLFDAVAGGADVTVTPAAFANRLDKLSLAIRNILKTPDVIGVVEAENEFVLDALADRLDADTAGATNYEGYLIEGNDIGGIDVGFLVNLNRVTVNSVTQVGASTTWINPHTGLQDPNPLNDRPPLVLEATAQRTDASAFDFVVIVNHLRSLGGVETDDASGRRVRAKRAAQAEFLADYIQQRQVSDPTERLIAVGDFNAFQFSDGYTDVMGTIIGAPAPAIEVTEPTDDLVDPNLTNLVETVPADQRYSYSFDGDAQILDHAVVNAAMLPSVNEFLFAHFDADFPEIYRNDDGRPERISDHDATVTYLDLSVTPQIAVSDTSVTELDVNTTMTFTVTLDSPATVQTTVNWLTSNGSALSGSDYTAAGGTVTFEIGDQSETVNVTVLGDNSFEPSETFLVTLSTPSGGGAVIADGEATGTILNDDTPVADLTLTMDIDPDEPVMGGEVTVTLVVTNNGPDGATDVVVTNDLPDGVTLLSVDSTQGSCTMGDPIVCTVGDLANGESATMTIVFRLPIDRMGPFVNSATADANEDDSTAAAASAVISPATLPAEIPTASETALLALMALLALAAVLKMRV